MGANVKHNLIISQLRWQSTCIIFLANRITEAALKCKRINFWMDVERNRITPGDVKAICAAREEWPCHWVLSFFRKRVKLTGVIMSAIKPKHQKEQVTALLESLHLTKYNINIVEFPKAYRILRFWIIKAGPTLPPSSHLISALGDTYGAAGTLISPNLSLLAEQWYRIVSVRQRVLNRSDRTLHV